jgi:putative ABC transport system permease protein
MRLTSVKGREVTAILEDKTNHIARWTLRHEYRSTYSDHLRDGEKLIAGTWHPQVGSDTNVVPISVEDGLAKELHVGLGDEMVFDVQGVPVTTRVASRRQVDWRRIQPNFFIVFPRGILEDAPAMDVLVTHASADEEVRLQRELSKQFPTISSIDLRLVLQTVDAIIEKISFVVRFMAMFTVLTGLLVLIGALLTGRYQRIQESILLRTLGASQKQILRILLVEYLTLGLLAALTGILLALAAAWALCHFVFEVHFVVEMRPLIVAFVAVPGLTVGTGMLMSRGILKEPPLAILRLA